MKKIFGIAVGLLSLCHSQNSGQMQCEEFPTGFYLSAAVGAVNNPWKDTADPVAGPSTVISGPDWTNGNWALTAGGFLGYQINQNFSVEAGGFWFDTVKIKEKIRTLSTQRTVDIDMKINELYALFAAVGVQAPMGPIYLNLKFGVGYQHVGIENPPASSPYFHSFNDAHAWGPMFGAALLYPLYDVHVVGLRYDRFAGDISHSKGEYVLTTNVISAQYAFYF